ncbi:hypothetical protein PYW08_003711 [Mythimna loreyi]|uniref:Uncharacterized protein n=1 Tax=Mythimna loreyi TaxID=667449 RepID=A0ACC2QUF9_9NEOP|nr:hypothetical protein PYW08_003711 [Mythimna loreyi]
MANGNGKTPQYSNCSNSGKQNYYFDSYEPRRNEFYDMNHKYRGKALIFSHNEYEIDIPERNGTVKDSNDLEKCLTNLAFNVDVHHNLKYAEIMKYIEQTANMNHSNNDCLLIVVLTHGKSGILYAKNTHYNSEKLWYQFTEENCPTLAGKPKLFIIQACQGEKYDDGITLTSGDYIETDGWFEPNKIPIHPDFLLAYSSVPGYYSWRNTTNGSWFIQSLCEELQNSATEMDLLTLLTFVSQKVALNFESYTLNPINDKKKIVPCFCSMLTRRLVFTEKPDNSNTSKAFLDYFKECTIKN